MTTQSLVCFRIQFQISINFDDCNNNNIVFFCSDLTTTNAVSRPLSAPVVSSSAMVDHSSDRSKDTSIINTDVTVSLKKNRSGEDKGKN